MKSNNMRGRFCSKMVIVYFLIGVLTTVPGALFAQLDSDGYINVPADGNIDLSGPGDYLDIFTQSTAPDTDPGGDPDVPVDGGLGFLLAAGLGFGANKLRKMRQKGT